MNIYNLFMKDNGNLDIMTKYNDRVINNEINRDKEFLKYFKRRAIEK